MEDGPEKERLLRLARTERTALQLRHLQRRVRQQLLREHSLAMARRTPNYLIDRQQYRYHKEDTRVTRRDLRLWQKEEFNREVEKRKSVEALHEAYLKRIVAHASAMRGESLCVCVCLHVCACVCVCLHVCACVCLSRLVSLTSPFCFANYKQTTAAYHRGLRSAWRKVMNELLDTFTQKAKASLRNKKELEQARLQVRTCSHTHTPPLSLLS